MNHIIQWCKSNFREKRLILLLPLFLALTFFSGNKALAGPVEWREVPASEAGRQWWDLGSLHSDLDGNLRVLSRFTPSIDQKEKASTGRLYVMDINCEEKLFRDASINGLPNFGVEWEPSGGDALIDEVINEVCSTKAT